MGTRRVARVRWGWIRVIGSFIKGWGVLEDVLTALAAAGGAAVVQAAGTDAWVGVREGVERLLSRGDPARRSEAAVRLENTAQVVNGANRGGPVLDEHQAYWRGVFETFLDGIGADDRERATQQLRALVSLASDSSAVGASSTGVHSNVFGGADFRAEGGSVAANVINGGVRIGNPPSPDANQA